MIDMEMMEQFKLVVDSVGQMIQDSEGRMTQKMEEMIRESEGRMEQMVKESEHNTRLYMELNLEKRIDALFDGYKLTHEKQWELEHETLRLKGQVDSLEARVALLEKEQTA